VFSLTVRLAISAAPSTVKLPSVDNPLAAVIVPSAVILPPVPSSAVTVISPPTAFIFCTLLKSPATS
jgi:hypothetical protein